MTRTDDHSATCQLASTVTLVGHCMSRHKLKSLSNMHLCSSAPSGLHFALLVIA